MRTLQATAREISAGIVERPGNVIVLLSRHNTNML